MRKYCSLVLKALVVYFAATGVLAAVKSSADSFMGGSAMLLYFTIQSNIAMAVVCLCGGILLLGTKKVPNWWHTVNFVATLSITLTGAVFCFVLAPTMGKYAWNRVNIYTHVFVPVLAIIDFFVSALEARIAKRNSLFASIPPLAYALFAGIGYIRNWQFAPGINYPYFFLNWGSPAGAFGFSRELPFMGCGWWILFLLVLLISVGYLYLMLLDGLKKACKK